jgi:hypothetical protein
MRKCSDLHTGHGRWARSKWFLFGSSDVRRATQSSCCRNLRAGGRDSESISYSSFRGGYGEGLKVKISIPILMNSLKTLSILKLMLIESLQ